MGPIIKASYAPFELDADQRVYYIPADAARQAPSNLFAILFDSKVAKKKWPHMYEDTQEMLVVNFNCLPTIPLHDSAVVLPFDLFLQCADAGMDYKDIVKRAIVWRKDNIEKNFAGKVSV